MLLEWVGLESEAVELGVWSGFLAFLVGLWLLQCQLNVTRGYKPYRSTDVSAPMSFLASSSRGRFWRVDSFALRFRPGFSDADELSSLYFGAVAAVCRVERRVAAIPSVLCCLLLELERERRPRCYRYDMIG